MLQNPDIAPSASVNRWILAILSFHFELVHVPGTHHGPDGLSRRPRQPDDDAIDEEAEDEVFNDWIDNLYSFMHIINPSPFMTTLSKSAARAVADTVLRVFALASNDESISYTRIPRTVAAQKEDARLPLVRQFLQDLKRPADLSDKEYQSFMRYCLRFFLQHEKLWRKDANGLHKVVVDQPRRVRILQECHDDVGHKGFDATRALILERFWWPHVHEDIKWYLQTCHLCQERQLRLVRVPPMVAQPAPLFSKVYIDIMHLPPSKGYHYLIQARCSLSHYPEYRALRTQTAEAIGSWLFEDLLCRWGALVEIVSDNGSSIVSACAYLSKQYKINHIRISGYNSQANGIVERAHFDVRQSLYKASSGDQSKWAKSIHTVFWAERVTVRRRMGVSPYFAVTGTHPLLPLDIVEATYLLPPPNAFLSTADLIARRAIELQKRREQVEALRDKVFEARIKAARRFESDYHRVIKDYSFQLGDLVLVRNTAIEKSLNRKMRARYNGPYVILVRNRGGAYVVCELDGSVLDRPVAAFRVVPYFARKDIEVPHDALDVHLRRLHEMQVSTSLGDDDEEVVRTPEAADDEDPGVEAPEESDEDGGERLDEDC